MSKLRVGYIPLVDAAAHVVAVDRGFAAVENLEIDDASASMRWWCAA
jgi:hypothetical protein